MVGVKGIYLVRLVDTNNLSAAFITLEVNPHGNVEQYTSQTFIHERITQIDDCQSSILGVEHIPIISIPAMAVLIVDKALQQAHPLLQRAPLRR